MTPGNTPRPFTLERVRGIEPPCSAWEADALPLSYTRGAAVHDLVRKVVRDRRAAARIEVTQFSVRPRTRPGWRWVG